MDNIGKPSTILYIVGYSVFLMIAVVSLTLAVVDYNQQPRINIEAIELQNPPQLAVTASNPRPVVVTSDWSAMLLLANVLTMMSLAIVFAIACVYSIVKSGDWPEVETHWGGLGGGLGGFRISPALLFLLAAIAFAGFTAGAIDSSVSAFSADTDGAEHANNSDGNSTDADE